MSGRCRFRAVSGHGFPICVAHEPRGVAGAPVGNKEWEPVRILPADRKARPTGRESTSGKALGERPCTLDCVDAYQPAHPGHRRRPAGLSLPARSDVLGTVGRGVVIRVEVEGGAERQGGRNQCETQEGVGNPQPLVVAPSSLPGPQSPTTATRTGGSCSSRSLRRMSPPVVTPAPPDTKEWEPVLNRRVLWLVPGPRPVVASGGELTRSAGRTGSGGFNNPRELCERGIFVAAVPVRPACAKRSGPTSR